MVEVGDRGDPCALMGVPLASSLLPQQDLDATAYLAQSGEDGVAKGAHAEGVDVADTLDLDQVTLDAGHHCPDVAEGDTGKQEAPKQCQWHAQQRGQQAVAPVLGHGEGGIADLPHTVEAVGTYRLSDHILKVHLQNQEGSPDQFSASSFSPKAGGPACPSPTPPFQGPRRRETVSDFCHPGVGVLERNLSRDFCSGTNSVKKGGGLCVLLNSAWRWKEPGARMEAASQ